MRWVLTLLVALVVVSVDGQRSYAMGEPLIIQCLDFNGGKEWTAGPQCGEEVMEIKYGVDAMTHCQLPVPDEGTYAALTDVIDRRTTWSCRVMLMPDTDIWIPFSIPLWGLVEPTHLHVDNHINFLFHAFRGTLIGVAAYPLKDKFEFAAIGSTLHMHGSTKWFKGGSFVGFSHSLEHDSAESVVAIIIVAALCSGITLICTASIMLGLYDCYLKPELKKSFTKMKQS